MGPMLEHVLVASINYLIPLLLGAVGMAILNRLKDNKRQDAMLLALGRYRLMIECEAALEQGFITPAQYETISELYKAYKGLGGNHLIEALYQRTTKLKIREVELHEH